MTLAVERKFAVTIVYTGVLRTPDRFNTERLAAAIELVTAGEIRSAASALSERYPLMGDRDAFEYVRAAQLLIDHNLVQEATA
ncbi:hypothetical protein [Catenuloplanes japonicus]|uniref:hypothetical protein n=1 Tax=Catenuloplanes japonicus TaxID=33876 RepID=UPI000524F58F|nr:hypothetical protein [Catenuloplanes japonicus]